MFMVERIWMFEMAISRDQVIRTVLGQGGRVFPGLAGRIAFELFCRTEDPSKPSGREQAAIDRHAPLMAKARTHRLKTRHGIVAAHEFRADYTASGSRVLVVHGWRSRTDFMAPMIANLVAGGYDVVGLDLPGHGLSDGRHLNLKYGVAAIDAAARQFGAFDMIVGHSFGGVVAVNAAVGSIRGFDAVACKRLAVIASPNSMPDLFDAVGRRMNLTPRANAAMAQRVRKVAGHPLSTYVMAEQLKRFDGPVLVLHAPDDREVAFAEGEAMTEAGPHVRLMPVPGRGHRRIIADEDVFAALGAFASRQGQPAVRKVA